MKFSPRLALGLAAPALLVGLQACATARDTEAALNAPIQATAQAIPPVQEASTGPALWKVADEDTTIYLFGTVHALPREVDWYTGAVENALALSGTLVTEIPAGAAQDSSMQQVIIGKAMLPADQSLRTLLAEDQAARYEAAMTGLGLPVAAFDRFEPWFAGISLSMLPLARAGYQPESGVEMVIEGLAGQATQRQALETVEFQLSMLDRLDADSQIAFLMAAVENVDNIAGMMDRMVEEWLEGDADGLAELMNQGLTDPELAEALLYSRNRSWADWIEARLDTPGTVFIAVGAGHLAGEKSVQDYLEERRLEVERVQ
ncbi:MAG: TraB/GumN family protein [Qipengyuania sp.]